LIFITLLNNDPDYLPNKTRIIYSTNNMIEQGNYFAGFITEMCRRSFTNSSHEDKRNNALIHYSTDYKLNNLNLLPATNDDNNFLLI